MTVVVTFSCFAQEVGNNLISFQLPKGFKSTSKAEYTTQIKKHLSEPNEYFDRDKYYYNDKGIGMVIREMEPFKRVDPSTLEDRKKFHDNLLQNRSYIKNYFAEIESYNGFQSLIIKYVQDTDHFLEIESDLRQGKYAIVVLEYNKTMSEEVDSIVNSIRKTIRLK